MVVAIPKKKKKNIKNCMPEAKYRKLKCNR